MFTILVGCKNESKLKPQPKTSDTELTAIITKQVDSLCTIYERFDYDWIEFFADDYTAIYPNSPIKQMTKESLKAQWERIYKKFDVKLLHLGRPTVIPSEDMAISYNTYNEIFINKETLDTTKNVST